MTEARRRQLETRLAADTATLNSDTTTDGDRAAPPIEALCSLAATELAVSGAQMTVLSELGGTDHRVPWQALVHATDTVSSGLADLQLTVGEGPCLDVDTTGRPMLVPDVHEAAGRWPAFTPGAVELGAVTMFSFPMRTGAAQLGTLNFYRDTTGPLSESQLSDALILTDLATQTTMAEFDRHATGDFSWLADPDAVVQQASGMVAVQRETNAETAMLHLRAYGYAHDLLLGEVARRVVARELNFRTG